MKRSEVLARLVPPAVIALLGMTIVWSGWMRLATSQPDELRPRLQLERNYWCLGEVAAGSELRARCTVRNYGDRRLIMYEAPKKSGCCSPTATPIVVPPGESVHFTVTSRFEPAPGAVTKQVRFHTNDPDRPTVTLTLAAMVIGNFS